MSRTRRNTFLTNKSQKEKNQHIQFFKEIRKNYNPGRDRYLTGRDGASNCCLNGHDAEHPKGYNSWDDHGKGRKTGHWLKRQSSKAARRYGKGQIKDSED